MNYNKLTTKSILCGLCLLMTTMVWGQRTLTLQEALDLAQKQSPGVMQSRFNLEQNQKSLEANQAALKTRLSLTVNPFNFDRTRQFNDLFSTYNTTENRSIFGTLTVSQPIAATDGVLSLNNRLSWQNSVSEFNDTDIRAYSNNLFLSLEQPLFTYNRRKLQIKELELNLERSQLSYAIQSLSLENTVTQSFYNVYKSEVDLRIAEEEYKNQQASFEITKNKVEAELLAKEELYQAELNVSTSRSTVENRRVDVETAKDKLKQDLGISLFEEIEIQVEETAFSPITIDVSFAINHALENRMEIRQQEISLEQASFDLIRTNAENEFKGTLSLSVGVFGDDRTFSEIYQSPTNNPRVSVSFAIPLWDWGEKKARMASTRAGINTTKIDLDQEKNNIISSIRDTYRQLVNIENQIGISEQSVRNAELTYDINLERYRNGDLTSIDLNDFQKQLSQQRSNLANNRIDYKLTLLNLKILSLWDFEKDQPILP